MDREWWMYDMPGKMTNVMQYGHDKHTRGMFLFASPPLAYDRDDLAQQKCLVEQAFAGETSWKIPALLDAMRESTDLYFDDVTQIHLPRWSKGRVVLLGDAGYAPTLITGQGTSLAFVGAYVLAGELKTAGGDHNVAFDRYQKVMRSYVEQNQRIALCGELSIPNSWAELEQKNARMREIHHTPDSALAEDSAGALIQNAANAIELADYVHV
jgi:2-polyprenyl-6-methoxyphenol hydroxylase-like FAD-dependent oxidoreductase